MCNVGGLDRTLRILIGIALIALTLTHHIGLWGWLGLIPLLTGLFGFCPLYKICGCGSCCKK